MISKGLVLIANIELCLVSTAQLQVKKVDEGVFGP